MQENTNQTDPAYQSKVYKALKENLQGFDRTEEGFKLSLKDRKYQSKVYKALKDNLEGFDKSEDEFYSLVSDAPQKKNPNANKNGVSNSGTGSSGFPKVDTDPYNVFPDTDTKTTQVKEKPQQKMATLNSDSFKQAMSKEKSVPKDLSGTCILNPIGVGIPM